MASFLFLSAQVIFVLMSTYVFHGQGLQFSQEDYEVRSHSVLLQGIREFQITETDLEVEDVNFLPQDLPTNLESCSCQGYTCGCCLHIKVKKAHLDDDVCLKFSYLPNEFGIQAQLTLNGKVIIQKKVSAKNPPAICAGIPHMKKVASICIRFYNLQISHKQFSGCAELQIKVIKVLKKTFKVGCFKIPPNGQALSFQNSQENSVQNDNIDAEALPMELFSEEVAVGKIENLQSCSCSADTCGCCMKVNMNKIHLHADVCLRVSYLPSEIGVAVELTVDNKTIFREKISVKNPPPICAGVPGLKKFASLCVHFYNLEVKDSHLSGCIDLEAKLALVVVEKIHLGCFKIPPTLGSNSPMTFLLEREDAYEMEKTLSDLEFNDLAELFLQETITKPGSCSCETNTCQCCLDLNIKKIHVHAKACIKVSYLPQEGKIRGELIIGGKSIVKKDVSVKSPPPICASYKKTLKVCMSFTNLQLSPKSLAGCIELKVKAKIVSKKFKVGCFTIPF